MKKIFSILLLLISVASFGQHHMMLALASQSTTPATWYDFRYATYKQQFSVATQEGTSQTMFFKPDGTIMYVLGSAGDDINQYALSTAWEVNSASYTKVKALNTLGGTSEGTPTGIFISPDGTYLFVIGSGADYVKQFTFGTAWDVATLSYTRELLISGQEGNSSGISFRPDGSYMYTIGTAGDAVDYYSLSTNWNISTASYLGTKSISTQSTTPREIYFKSDGTEMYLLDGDATDFRVHKYTMSTPWDIANLTYSTSRDLYNTVIFTETTPTGLFFKGDDCSRMYVVGTGGDAVWQYNMEYGNLNNTELLYSTNVSSISTMTKRGLFIDDLGQHLYFSGDSIIECSISSDYDSRYTSRVRATVFDSDSKPGISFKQDGLKYFLIRDATGDYITHQSISTAWNISTYSGASVNFTITSTTTGPTGITLKRDGIAALAVGNTNDDIDLYTMSTAWDASTSTNTTSVSLSSYDTELQGIVTNKEGTIVYIIGSSNDKIYSFYLPTAFSISTMVFLNDFSISSQETTPYDIALSPEGKYIYIIGGNNYIYQYSTF